MPVDLTDPPLASDLEAFINGAGPDDLSEAFARWTEALARIRVQDQKLMVMCDCMAHGKNMTAGFYCV